jgi:acyl-coenzyme A thioesterase PaaI-like protein
MNLSELLAREPDANNLEAWLRKVPYAAYLGIRAEVRGDDILFILPGDERMVGNPSPAALHGGVVGAFMEQAGTFHLLAKMDNPVLPRIIDFSIDYLRPARVRDTYARCELNRQGRFIANVSITAWQQRESEPAAIARAHFLIPDNAT